jgi:hypothetical protein
MQYPYRDRVIAFVCLASLFGEKQKKICGVAALTSVVVVLRN